MSLTTILTIVRRFQSEIEIIAQIFEPFTILEKSEKIAKEEMEDRSTVIRELLALGLKQYMIKDAMDKYVDGKVSMEKAAELADASIWKFLDLLKERKMPIGMIWRI